MRVSRPTSRYLIVLALWLAGCAGDRAVRYDDDPRIRRVVEAAAEQGAPLPYRIGVMPLPVFDHDQQNRDFAVSKSLKHTMGIDRPDLQKKGWTFQDRDNFDREAFRALLIEAMNRHQAFTPAVRPFLDTAEIRGTTVDERDVQERYLDRAWRVEGEEPFDIVVTPRVTTFQVSYVEHNRNYLLKQFVNFMIWLPHIWIHSDIYQAKVSVELVYWSVATRRELCRATITGSADMVLSATDVGVGAGSLFGLPAAHEEGNWHRVHERIMPHAWNEFLIQFQAHLRLSPEALAEAETQRRKADVETRGDAGGASDLRTVVAGPAFHEKMAKHMALVVGISDYEYLPALQFAARDAESIHAFLKDPEQGAIEARPELIRPDQLQVLVDRAATKEAIRGAVDRIRLRSLEDDEVFIYFAGYGAMRSPFAEAIAREQALSGAGAGVVGGGAVPAGDEIPLPEEGAVAAEGISPEAGPEAAAPDTDSASALMAEEEENAAEEGGQDVAGAERMGAGQAAEGGTILGGDLDRDRAYLIPCDAALDENFETRAIAFEELAEWLRPVRARKIVLLVDTAFNGEIEGRSLTTRLYQQDLRGAVDSGLFHQALMEALGNREKVIPIISTSVGDDAYEHPDFDQHGIFTYYFIEKGAREGDADRDSDGRVTLAEAVSYAAQLVEEQTRTEGRAQTPVALVAGEERRASLVSEKELRDIVLKKAGAR